MAGAASSGGTVFIMRDGMVGRERGCFGGQWNDRVRFEVENGLRMCSGERALV